MTERTLDIDLISSALNENAARLREASAIGLKMQRQVLREIISGAEVVYGVFENAGNVDGFGYYLVKGKQLLTDIAGSQGSRSVRSTAIPCASIKTAMAIAAALGDEARWVRGRSHQPSRPGR
jgi:hypothetical protein